MKFDISIAGRDSIECHLREKQDKYVAAFTNIQNLKELVKVLKIDMLSKEEIKAMDKLITDGNKDLTWERDKFKQMYVIMEQNEQQIRDNENAVRLYTKNIKFLQKQLINNK